jgi:hypothetical protein
MPRNVLLKRMDRGHGEREVAFYRTTTTGERPLVRCIDAEYDQRDGSSHLLLEDLSSTHIPGIMRDDLLEGRGVPARLRLEGILTALASFHARRWDDSRLGERSPFEIRAWFADDDSMEAHVERRRREVAALDRSLPWLPLYERALDKLSDIWRRRLRARIERRAALTLVHGDCYLTQFLVPRAESGETFLVDLDSVGGAPGAFDLAFLLPTFWTKAQRAENELRCLRTYHDSLLANGVDGYDWDDLLLDYRMMIAFVVFDPVFDHANGSPTAYWEPKMRCLTAAYVEWDCDQL